MSDEERSCFRRFRIVWDSRPDSFCFSEWEWEWEARFVSRDKPEISAHFDGGETGCGELLLDLLIFMRKQPANAVVEVRALDPGAPLEIPAWCRLTKHILVSGEHPFYLIQIPNNK